MMTDHTHQLDDATLVSRAQAGDHLAFEALARRYYTGVERLCARLLGATFEESAQIMKDICVLCTLCG